MNDIYTKLRVECIQCTAKHIFQLQDHANFGSLTIAQIYDIYVTLVKITPQKLLLVSIVSLGLNLTQNSKQNICNLCGSMSM